MARARKIKPRGINDRPFHVVAIDRRYNQRFDCGTIYAPNTYKAIEAARKQYPGLFTDERIADFKLEIEAHEVPQPQGGRV